jgi:hypothetical protein
MFGAREISTLVEELRHLCFDYSVPIDLIRIIIEHLKFSEDTYAT